MDNGYKENEKLINFKFDVINENITLLRSEVHDLNETAQKIQRDVIKFKVASRIYGAVAATVISLAFALI